jgi:hypothetical protein
LENVTGQQNRKLLENKYDIIFRLHEKFLALPAGQDVFCRANIRSTFSGFSFISLKCIDSSIIASPAFTMKVRYPNDL